MRCRIKETGEMRHTIIWWWGHWTDEDKGDHEKEYEDEDDEDDEVEVWDDNQGWDVPPGVKPLCSGELWRDITGSTLMWPVQYVHNINFVWYVQYYLQTKLVAHPNLRYTNTKSLWRWTLWAPTSAFCPSGLLCRTLGPKQSRNIQRATRIISGRRPPSICGPDVY